MNASTKRYFPIFLLVLSFCLHAGGENKSIEKYLSTQTVIRLADHFVDTHKMRTEGQKISEVTYIPERRAWLVMYSANSLSLGDGGFGLIVEDNDSKNITVQKGL